MYINCLSDIVTGKTRCTPETIETICGLIRDGNYLRPAAAACGISYHTVRRWVEWGTKGKTVDGPEEPWATFVREVRKAEADLQTEMVQKWKKGINDIDNKAEYAKAIPNFLKLRFPEEWGDKSTVHVDASVNLKSSPEWKDLISRISALSPEKQIELSEALFAEDNK